MRYLRAYVRSKQKNYLCVHMQATSQVGSWSNRLRQQQQWQFAKARRFSAVPPGGEQDRVKTLHDGPGGDAAERSPAAAMAIPASTHPHLAWCCSKFNQSYIRLNAQLCAALPELPASTAHAGLAVMVKVILPGRDWKVLDYLRNHQRSPALTTMSSCKQTGQHDIIQHTAAVHTNKAMLGPFPAKLVHHSVYYELCSIQHEGLLKIFDDGGYFTVLQERVS